MNDISIETAVIEFQTKLKKKLQYEKVDSKKINEYIDSTNKAKVICSEQFTGEFGSFGGQFTSHGPDHAARVLHNSIKISERLSPIINATEFFFLGLAALLHDIGMTAPLPIEFTEKVIDEDRRWIERRKRHGEATAEIILKCEAPELKIISKPDQDSYFKFLPHICAAHCTDGFEKHINEIRNCKKQSLNKNRFEIISGILLLADELDISCLRARPDINRYNEFKSALTKAHWWKHWLISEVNIAGNTIYISCLDENVINWIDEFIFWTKSKLEKQISTLKYHLDINGNHPIWNFEIKIVPIDNVWWQHKLPNLTMNIIEEAQKERLKITGQKMIRIIEPEKLIEGVADGDAILQPSTFFRKVIARRITHFRGQGQYIKLKDARLLYVEESRNMELLNHAVNEWKNFVSENISGVNLKMFVGDIGVGKTHFLSAFLYEASTRHSNIYSNTIIARAEFTECERNNLLSMQKHVALSLFKDLNMRLCIAETIREIMIRDFSKGLDIPIPKHIEEIENWNIEKINSFISVVGMICQPTSNIHKALGDKAPNALCLFCDNSDQLKKEIIGNFYDWSNNISGKANCLVWIFLRPETLAYLENIYQRAPYGLRGAEPIFAPTLKEVITKRLETFPNRFDKDETVEIPFGSGIINAIDIQKSVTYIVNLTLETSVPILPKLTERLDGDGQPNLRAGLQALLSILGSHIISDEEYGRAILLQNTLDTQLSKEKNYKPVFERWPKIIEALILGRRVWYSPRSGAVENLLDPPQIESYGDYFIIIHCLQILLKHKSNEFRFHQICNDLNKLGYQQGRIQEIIKHLASRATIEEQSPQEDPFLKRTFPLVEVQLPSLDLPFRDNTLIQITPWGEFHLKTILEQAQYWKHIYYQIILPASLARSLETDCVKGHVYKLKDQLSIVFDYLIGIEKSWMYNINADTQIDIGLSIVMHKVKEKVLNQLG